MNKFKEDAIKNYIDMNHLFLSLLKESNFDNEALKLMTQNHSMMRSALIDLGVEFSDVETIRKLNEKIRNMESSLNSDGFNYQKVSVYVENIKNILNDALESNGVHGSVTVSFSPNLVIDLNLYPHSKSKPNNTYWSDEDEYNDYCNKLEHNYNEFIKNYIFVANNDDKYMAYDIKNINSILNVVQKTLNVDIFSYSYQLNTRYIKTENKNKEAMPTLGSIKMTSLTLSSHSAFAESFDRINITV